MSNHIRILFALCVLAVASTVSANTLTTGNKFVTALVEDGTGLIWFLKGSSAIVPPSVTLSFRNKSFLSVRVGSKVYSNNDVTSLQQGRADVLLDNGINSKIGDTIETIWQETGFDIVQDVYPVEFEISGQIVYKVRIVNHSTFPIPAQEQYLLDIDVNGNDRTTTLTRYNYTPNWTQYPNAQRGIPWFYMGLENVPSAPNPGSMGTGYVNDTLAPQPIGLIQPDMFAIVDWFKESDFAWGLMPNPPIGGAYGDAGIFIEWPKAVISGSGKDTVLEIGRGSYGTGEFEMCFGNLLAITLYPHRIKYDWKTKKYSPNPFHVESMIFNVNSNQDATKARASLNTYSFKPPGPIRIVSPVGATTKPDGSYLQVQDIGAGIIPGVGGTIPRLDVAEADWIDSTLDVTNTFGDSAASMTINFTCQGINQPSFIPPCEMPIIIESAVRDTTLFAGFPQQKVVSRTGSFDGSDCNARCTQAVAVDLRACATCYVKGIETMDVQNMNVLVQDSNGQYSVCAIDSMQNGSATVVAIDGTGERDTVTYNYCTIRDTLAPRYLPGFCKQGICFYVDEQRPWDRGIDTIILTNVVNTKVSFSPAGSPRGLTSVLLTATPIDDSKPSQFCYKTIDLAGNITIDSCISSSPALEVLSEESRIIALSAYPNPATDITTINLIGAEAAYVEVLDILGRSMDGFSIAGSFEWNTNKLAAGAYILRVMTRDGVASSLRIVKR